MGVATATTSASNGPRQVSDGDPSGSVLGISASDPIGFFGTTTPQAQTSGPAQAAVTRGQAAAVIGTFGSTQTPAGAAANSTTEVSMTVIGATSTFRIAANDLLLINKLTSQAGLGIGNIRVSAANVAGVTFDNVTASVVTPTTNQKYGIVAMRGVPSITAVLTPAATTSNSVTEQQFTVPGIRAGELVHATKPTSQAGLDLAGFRVVTNNTVGISFLNASATTTLTPTAGETYIFWSLGGLDASNNEILIQANVGTLVGLAANTSAEQAVTVTGLTTSDAVAGWSKPTNQAGLFVSNIRSSPADTANIAFGNLTGSAVTPTASECYQLSIRRPAPAAPLVVFSQTITPAGVAANTTAEQTFACTPLIASSIAFVNKPTSTQNLGITGVRVAAANSLGITFANTSATTITPPTETYVIGNYTMVVPDAGDCWMQSVNVNGQQASVLANAIRSALSGMSLIAGA